MPHIVRECGGKFCAMLPAALAVVFAIVLAAPGAGAAEPYSVSGVKVQAAGAKPELARSKAIGDGEMAAFNRLIRRMTLPEDHARLPKPAADSVRGAILNFSIENENQQGDKYSATVTYRFDRELVRAMLEGASIPFIDTQSPPVVVLPVWTEETKAHLWDDPNPWREAWMRYEPEDSLVDFVRARGDLADLKAISAEEAVPANKAALGRIADQYKAGLVAIARATTEKGKRRITVTLVDLANGRATSIGVFAVGDDAPALDKAAAQIARAIDATWKRGAVAVEQNAVVIRFRVPIQGLDHWIRIRQALQAMPQVRALTSISMSPGEALIELRFAGTLAELRRQIEQRGFTVAPERAGTPAAPPPGNPPVAPGNAPPAGEVWVLTAPVTPPVKQTDLPPEPATPPDKAPEKTPEKVPPADKKEPEKKP
jgi:hypothetical protein